jgi:hypothetical protein
MPQRGREKDKCYPLEVSRLWTDVQGERKTMHAIPLQEWTGIFEGCRTDTQRGESGMTDENVILKIDKFLILVTPDESLVYQELENRKTLLKTKYHFGNNWVKMMASSCSISEERALIALQGLNAKNIVKVLPAFIS